MCVAPFLQLVFTAIIKFGLRASDHVLARLQLGERTRRLLMRGALAAALFVRNRCGFFGLLCRLFCNLQLCALAVKLLFNLDQLGIFRRDQTVALLLQTHATRLKLRDTFLGVTLFEPHELRITFDGTDGLLHVGQRRGRSTQRGFRERHRHARQLNQTHLISMFGRGDGHRIIGLSHRFGKLHRLLKRRDQARLTLSHLTRNTLRTITLERQRLLDARHFRIDFVERALRRMLRIVLRKYVLPQALKLRHERLQFRFFGEQRSLGLTEHFDRRFAHANGVVPPLRKQQRLTLQLFLFKLAITRGDFRLHFKAIHLCRQFRLNIANPRQIFLGVGQSIFGVFASLFVARHTGGFFEKYAQFFRLSLDDARNHALLDNRIGTRSETGAKEYIQNVATTHWLVVQVVA